MLFPEVMITLLTSDSEEAKTMQSQFAKGMGLPENQLDNIDLMEVFKQMPDIQLEGAVTAMKKQLDGYPEYMPPRFPRSCSFP